MHERRKGVVRIEKKREGVKQIKIKKGKGKRKQGTCEKGKKLKRYKGKKE